MIRLAKGDTVKLTDKFARTLMKSSRRRRHNIDWRSRRGVVCHVNRNDVLVIWNHMKAPDNLPVRAVEKVQP